MNNNLAKEENLQDKVENTFNYPQSITSEELKELVDEVFQVEDYSLVRKLGVVFEDRMQEGEDPKDKKVYVEFLIKRWLEYKGAENLKREEGLLAGLSKLTKELEKKYPSLAGELVDALEDKTKNFLKIKTDSN